MASPYFLGGAPTAATNWSTGSVITGSNADTGTVDARMNSNGLTGANQATVLLSRLDIFAQQYNIGSTATPWQVGAGEIYINRPPADGSSNAGPATIAIDLGTFTSTGSVFTSRSVGTSSQEPIHILANNASNVLNVLGGVVGVARTTPAATSTLGTLSASGSSIVNIGSGATVSLVEVDDQASVRNFGTLSAANIRGGTLEQDDDAAIGTVSVFTGGTAKVLSRRSGDEITHLISYGGTLDVGPDTRAVSVGTLTLRGNLTVRYATTPSQFSFGTMVVDTTSPYTLAFVKA